MADRSLEPIIGVVVLLAFLIACGFLLARLFTRRRERKTRQTRALADLGSAPAFCLCGQPVERAASRTGEPTLLDDLFPAWRRVSLAAQYRVTVPRDGVPTLCALHARAWDARLERKVIEAVELARADLHQAVADRLAAYEGGELAAELEATLTELQRRERKRLDANRAKPSGKATVTILSPDAFAKGADVAVAVVPAAEVGQCPPSPVPGVLS